MNTLNEILSVTTKPIIFDADTGGRNEHLPYTIKALDRAGISAAIIEDKIGLKRIHYLIINPMPVKIHKKFL